MGVVGLGAADDFGEAAVDGARLNRQGRDLDRIGDVIDETSDMASRIRQAGNKAGDALDGGCFRSGTAVHKIANDELLAALVNPADTVEESGRLTWWILAAVSFGVVAGALKLEKKRQQQHKPSPVELAASVLDELFTTDSPWEPPLTHPRQTELAIT